MSLFRKIIHKQQIIETFYRKDVNIITISNELYFGYTYTKKIYLILTLDPEVYFEIDIDEYLKFSRKFPQIDEGEILILRTKDATKIVVKRKGDDFIHVYFCEWGRFGNGRAKLDQFISGINNLSEAIKSFYS